MTALPLDFLDAPIAHRTLHDVTDGRPENSLAGARAAIAAGFSIEIDIQLTKDDHALVYHDYHLERLTEAKGFVRDKTLAEMSDIPLRGSNEAAPSLATFLELIDGRVPLLIELKDQDLRLEDKPSALEKAVCDDLRDYAGVVALMSFNPHMMARCAELAPEIARGLVTDPYTAKDWPAVSEARRAELRDMSSFDEVGARFISHNVHDLDAAPVQKIKQQGHPILCWTVKSSKVEAKARRVAQNVTFEGYLPD